MRKPTLPRSLSLFKNNDQEFAEIAADPVRRRAAIADLAGREAIASADVAEAVQYRRGMERENGRAQ